MNPETKYYPEYFCRSTHFETTQKYGHCQNVLQCQCPADLHPICPLDMV